MSRPKASSPVYQQVSNPAERERDINRAGHKTGAEGWWPKLAILFSQMCHKIPEYHLSNPLTE